MLPFPHFNGYDGSPIPGAGFELEFMDISERPLKEESSKLVKMITKIFVARNTSREVHEVYSFQIGPGTEVQINLDD